MDNLGIYCFYPRFKREVVNVRQIGEANKRFPDTRIPFLLEIGQQRVSDPIARDFGRRVCRVFPPTDLPPAQSLSNFLRSHVEKRPDHSRAGTAFDPTQAVKARAAQQVKQNSFRLVVMMVGRGDQLCPTFRGTCMERSVASVPGNLFQRSTMRPVEGADVDNNKVKRDIERACQITDPPCVSIGGFGAEAMVDVGDVECQRQLLSDHPEHDCERGAVRSAGNRQENGIAGLDEPVVANRPSHFADEPISESG